MTRPLFTSRCSRRTPPVRDNRLPRTEKERFALQVRTRFASSGSRAGGHCGGSAQLLEVLTLPSLEKHHPSPAVGTPNCCGSIGEFLTRAPGKHWGGGRTGSGLPTGLDRTLQSDLPRKFDTDQSGQRRSVRGFQGHTPGTPFYATQKKNSVFFFFSNAGNRGGEA